MDNNDKPQDQGFLPQLCSAANLFMLVLLVELLALVLSLAGSSHQDFWDRLAMISMLAQWVALINAAVLCQLRDWLNRQPVVVNTAISFSIMMSVSLLVSLAISYLQTYLGLTDPQQTGWFNYGLLRNLAISALVYGVVLRYFYIHHQWLINLQAQGHAQVQALKARIHPHFLFNSMNTIASLIHIDADKAEKAVEDLSDLFRASLRGETRHTLAEEFALVHSYVDIETLRFGDRLQTEWSFEDLPMELEVPTLCLQPLVENAIYYGIEPRPEGGIIKIKGQIENNRLCLSVSNPISPPNHVRNHKSNHMAQDNIRKRLALMYGDEASFDIDEQGDDYTVALRIPINAIP